MNYKTELLEEKFKKTLSNRNYSEKTILQYLYYAKKFYESFNKRIQELTLSDLENYLLNYPYSSISQQNIIINSIKLFYSIILGKSNIHLEEIKRPRNEKKLPRVIDKDEIINKLSTIDNIKHKAILSLTFSVGLRVSEIVNLKIVDINSKRMIIDIKNAKGRKDRIVPLTEKILLLLREYYLKFKPKEYLFNGQNSLKYSIGSCQKIYKKYIEEKSSIHTLRHSSFTSMLEEGTDISVIQKVAGHSSYKTTQIYTHLTKKAFQTIKNPI